MAISGARLLDTRGIDGFFNVRIEIEKPEIRVCVNEAAESS